jgi:hypothetical protein
MKLYLYMCIYLSKEWRNSINNASTTRHMKNVFTKAAISSASTIWAPILSLNPRRYGPVGTGHLNGDPLM